MQSDLKTSTRPSTHVNTGKIGFVAGKYSETSPLAHRLTPNDTNPTLYDESYSSSYESFYLQPWMKKHQLNLDYIQSILATLPFDQLRWLDLCCGQAWHFAALNTATLPARHIEKLGVDQSPSQLKRAVLRNPDANFLLADVLKVSLPRHGFALVTSFWAAYCYLNSTRAIKTFLSRAIEWTHTGGAFYLEVLTGEKLMSFNDSPFAAQTGFQVIPQNRDYSEWIFEDSAGQHHMTSPSLDFFIDIVSPYFSGLEAKQDSGFMTHLICTGKKDLS